MAAGALEIDFMVRVVRDGMRWLATEAGDRQAELNMLSYQVGRWISVRELKGALLADHVSAIPAALGLELGVVPSASALRGRLVRYVLKAKAANAAAKKKRS
jgi:hypothetical protein